MLLDAGLGKKFWAEAWYAASYLTNRSPTQSLDGRTPYEAWHSRKPQLNHLRRLGYDACLTIDKSRRSDFDTKTRCCIVLGYVHDTTKLWKLWDPVQNCVINGADIHRDEDNNTASRALPAGLKNSESNALEETTAIHGDGAQRHITAENAGRSAARITLAETIGARSRSRIGTTGLDAVESFRGRTPPSPMAYRRNTPTTARA